MQMRLDQDVVVTLEVRRRRRCNHVFVDAENDVYDLSRAVRGS